MTQPPDYGPVPGEPADPRVPPSQPGQWAPQQPPPPPPPGQQPGQGYPSQSPPPQWPQSPQQPPPPGQPQQPWPGYQQPGQGQWAPQQGHQQPGQWPPQQAPQGYQQPGTLTAPSKPHGRGKLIAGAVAVVVLAGGGVATYVAMSDSNGKGGAASPKQAVQGFVDDLNHSDFLGLLDDLAPGEKRALADPVRDEIDQLKRLKVLKSDADPNKVAAVQFSATGLTYNDKTVSINDHVQIVQVTGGKLTVSADASKIPLTKEFIDAVLPDGMPSASTGKQTVNLADAIRKNSGKPIQVATEKVGGRWYPSLFYTAANYAAASAGLGTPNASDRIPDNGASSSDQAVRDAITALVNKDYKRAIELASPSELGVLHDYGPLILQAAGSSGGGSSSFTIKDIQFNHKSISGGERLTLKSLVAAAGSQQIKVAVDDGCYTVTIGGDTRRMCASELIDGILSSFGGDSPQQTPAQRTAFTHLLAGVTNVGIDVSQTGGKWYVDAVHSYFDIVNSVLSGLQGNDLYELIAFFRR